jgi:hypothetical protein
MNSWLNYFSWLFLGGLLACHSGPQPMFQLLDGEETGVDFVNEVKPTPEFNIFSYMYFYNGGGVGAGDFNNDGLVDLVFTANQTADRLYLNQGEMKFLDVTAASGLDKIKGWHTGVSVVDINQDGMLDMYISCVAKYSGVGSHNLLYICENIDDQGVPHFVEKSREYGLDLVGFGTQAAFFDYDLDGDLDFFQLNHSVHQNGTFGKRGQFMGTVHPQAGDRFFENKDGKYVEATAKVGINSSALGYGLGLSLGDVNLDGYPDFYVGNDFHENDYLYINQQNGSFRDEIDARTRHTSRFTMGVDIADLNNDIFPEIMSLDMMPYDPKILKRSEGEDAYYNFKFKLDQGYNVQFARNNLQLNTRQGIFSEVGMYAGVHATDWSWSALLLDFENDGRKDIFISNGINKRMNDMDYINFVASDDIQRRISEQKFDESDASLIDLLPEVKIPNKFFSNTPSLIFKDQSDRIAGNVDSYSNGATYADLDNDGDLDIVTNNINEAAFIYENLAETYAPTHKNLTVKLQGPVGNRHAIGAKCLVYNNDGVQYQEKFPVRGFQSSTEMPLLFGLGEVVHVDSVVIVWPNNSFSTIKRPDFAKPLIVSYAENLPKFDYIKLKTQRGEMEDIAAQIGLDIKHEENRFNEFDRESLIPNMMSTEGPALAVGDVNGDGRDDIFMGASRGVAPKIYTQQPNGRFTHLPQPALDADADFEDIDAAWADVNGDGAADLIVGSGGNEYFGKSEFLRPRLYLNDGRGKLIKDTTAFAGIYSNAQVIRVADMNQDGFPDLFLGARSVPFAYGRTPESYLFINDKTGNFIDKTDALAPGIKKGGLVKDAQWGDFDADKDVDLVVAFEWGKIVLFENRAGKLSEKPLTDKKGWWNFIKAVDLDQDGDLDLVCGNVGLNSRLHASEKEPVRMYVNDFDDNGRPDQILTYYLQGQETIFADKREVEKQLPYVRKSIIKAKDFAEATLQQVFGAEKVAQADVLEANYFENAFLENLGNGQFELKSMGGAAQFTSYHAAEPVHTNSSGTSELLMLGNFFDSNIQLGLYDADNGSLFDLNKKHFFTPRPLLDERLEGQVRSIKKIRVGGRTLYLVVRNNDTLMALTLKK